MNTSDTIAKLHQLKKDAGSHSPSISTIQTHIPQLSVKVDGCFLSNPYATDLFFERLSSDFPNTNDLRKLLELYPSQNRRIAKNLSEAINVSDQNIFVGNGAIEVIQAILHNFVKQGVSLPLPTFSPYYEFIPSNIDISYYYLSQSNNFDLDLSDYVQFIRKNNVDTAILINPNNPTGNYISYEHIVQFLKELADLNNIILDESFIHFVDTDSIPSVTSLVEQFPNLIVVKSLSKDFGIAGIRLGYGVLNSERVSYLLNNGYLWNTNGLAEYFTSLYKEKDFRTEYEQIRKQFIKESQEFYSQMNTLYAFQIYPSYANFILAKIQNQYTADDLFAKLLVEEGVYVRTCSDKAGLDGEFLRIASRGKEENQQIYKALQKYDTY